MKNIQISIPDDLNKILANVSSNKNTFIVEAIKSKIKDALIVKKNKHSIHPHISQTIEFDDTKIKLKDNIECTVEYQDNLYFVKFPFLDINVWGDTRKEVIEAFNFAFISLYENLALENDDKLTKKTKELKEKIIGLVAQAELNNQKI